MPLFNNSFVWVHQVLIVLYDRGGCIYIQTFCYRAIVTVGLGNIEIIHCDYCYIALEHFAVVNRASYYMCIIL